MPDGAHDLPSGTVNKNCAEISPRARCIAKDGPPGVRVINHWCKFRGPQLACLFDIARRTLVLLTGSRVSAAQLVARPEGGPQ
jgi:hypothetical protein